mgnify:CR=1 FL=1|tara:strand:- start:1863 stop:2612 length:750 start_codon:yes stop_codon:yes gene_type:complete
MSSTINRAKKSNYSRPTPEILIQAGMSYKYTKGEEFTTVLGREYIGEYHLRKDGKFYTGPTQPIDGRDDSVQLLSYYRDHNNFDYDRLQEFVTPVKDQSDPIPYEWQVRTADGLYELGYDTRYFVQKRGLGTYAIEIDLTQRDSFGSPDGIDSRIYDVVDIRWQLTGTLSALEAANKDSVNIASRTIPDLPFIIRNYTQYAKATEQALFSSLDSQLRKKDQKMIGNKVKIKQTFDPETGKIIKARDFDS